MKKEEKNLRLPSTIFKELLIVQGNLANWVIKPQFD